MLPNIRRRADAAKKGGFYPRVNLQTGDKKPKKWSHPMRCAALLIGFMPKTSSVEINRFRSYL
jgi:hypothetical protein